MMNLYAVVCETRKTQVKLVMAEDPARAVEVVARKRLAKLLADGYCCGDSQEIYWAARVDAGPWVSVVADDNYGHIICYEGTAPKGE